MELDTKNTILLPNQDKFEKVSGGLHILGDFYGCRGGQEYMLDADLLYEFCSEQVKQAGLTEIGQSFYQFPDAGVTGTILLAESHVAIHTWPEKDYLTLDVFVCNVTQDNTEKAKKLFNAFVELFQPEDLRRQDIDRD
ncbi:MAG: adenosylmethionine decarboxylase [Candidatus Hydrogenedentota bacterium]|nr:MAG: adenosylmethionine decarboxylase [Candidatus Hydrogenedentota bacterium]